MGRRIYARGKAGRCWGGWWDLYQQAIRFARNLLIRRCTFGSHVTSKPPFCTHVQATSYCSLPFDFCCPFPSNFCFSFPSDFLEAA